MVEMTIGGNEPHFGFLRQSDVECVVERKLTTAGQANGPIRQLVGGRDEFDLDVVEGLDRAQNVAVGKAGIVEQGISDLINDEIGRQQRSLPSAVTT